MFDSVKSKDFLLLPNLFSISRILVLPFLYYTISQKDDFISLILLIYIGLSDFLDGFTARRYNQVSDLGKILDPLADKIAIAITALALVIYYNFPLWFLIFLIVKDLLIFFGGSWLYKSKGIVTMANVWGKYTTFFLAILTAFIFLEKPLGLDQPIEDYNWFIPRDIPLLISFILAVISFLTYVKVFIVSLKSDKH